MEHGQLYVIAKEGDVFHKKIFEGHLGGIQEYSDINGLGYKFSLDDYQDAPCILATLGNIVIKSVDSSGIIIFYLPEYVSDEQNMWIFQNRQLFDAYSMVGCFQVKGVEDNYTTENVNGLDNVIKRINRNNILYNKLNEKEKKIYGIKKR